MTVGDQLGDDLEAAAENLRKALDDREAARRGAPLDIGVMAWERQPEEGDYSPRGGMVVDIGDGTVLCVQAGLHRGKATLHVVRLEEPAIDLARTEPADPFRMRRMARHICAALGAKPGRWTAEDLAWLDRAQDLAREG